MPFTPFSSNDAKRRVYALRVQTSTPDALTTLAYEHSCLAISTTGLKADVGQLLDKIASGELVISKA